MMVVLGREVMVCVRWQWWVGVLVAWRRVEVG